MIIKNKLMSLILAGTIGVSLLTGCSKDNNDKLSDSSKDIKTIGITQLVEHPSLDKARDGFIKALEDKGYKDGENIKIDYQNAQNDMPTTQMIANKFVSDKKDLIYSISTPSAQAAYNATKDIPILITAVTDPVAAGLVKSIDKPEGNVSGTSDYISIDKNLELIKMFIPDAKTIGVLYNTSEVNSKIQVDTLKEYASKNNYKVVEKGVSSSMEISQAMSSLVGKIDVLYVPTDNLIVSSMPIVSKIATNNKVPIISSEDGSVKSGALACQGIDYEKLGYKTGELAIKVLNGEEISNIPVTMLDETQIIVNEDTLKSLSLKKIDDKNITYIKTKKN
ncbi:ABC transporter substrate binding family protein [Clostridium argentinense CDC 2741]|uniref:ABC transporter substrate binding family protein n=1 Tax=Clostridium argentinense CDC 2741 TaxID=1418104 RepID=A0A0C1UGR0_9CLOT|nr:ABC transporter substrate-binding protein [Clostridium argentinense]ARC86508.1 ABC transporter substrate-binding protein [Clostridium argentinense]KIE46580.1 ABC transporter substrate binding family protein [Clostridium argentinense CDC 2741]NFF37972.1 ABC transporter substrate-binding protein [Clostridium argentinense]NFP49954.1 ABC transporter substrate-binding protein [Clostridium argentinense]NFP71364.1 ABC transporter substrate-binding protein [Clostridium argentinense]